MAKTVSQKLNIPESVVIFAYKSYFENIRNKIGEISFMDESILKDTSSLPMSFNLQFIGKLHTKESRIVKINENKKLSNEIKRY